jgi:hypothetical protein
MGAEKLASPTGIDPGTVRQVAQRLNHYATPDPIKVKVKRVKFTLKQSTKAQRSRGIALLFL